MYGRSVNYFTVINFFIDLLSIFIPTPFKLVCRCHAYSKMFKKMLISNVLTVQTTEL